MERDRRVSVTVIPNDPRESMLTTERPWGSYEQFCLNEQVSVKIITVNPGHRLSLQTHQHRAEFWQVLDGTIDVTVGERTWTAKRDERVWVPVGELHRMANSTDAPVRVLEVCWGHFDDEDIVRVEDDYHR